HHSTHISSICLFFFFSSRRRHTRFSRDWSSDVCSSDLVEGGCAAALLWLSLSEVPVAWYYAVLVLYGCGRAFTGPALSSLLPQRSEERRVGKECRSRWRG